MKFFIERPYDPVATETVMVPSDTVDAVVTLIVMTDYSKIRAIKLLRLLQWQPNFWAYWVERKYNEMPANHLGLKDAKDLVEFCAKQRGIEFRT